MHRVLLIGAGSICQTHIGAFESLQGRARVVGVAALHLDSAQRAIDAAGIHATAYADYKEAIAESGCDIVSVITPPDTHCEITVYALKHHCHVLVEKPMAPSLAECDAMIEAARRTGNRLEVVAQSRFLTPIYRTNQLIKSGAAGRLLFTQVNSFWYRGLGYYDLAWRGTWASEGGGCTFVHAVHQIDLLLWLAGMPSEVTAIIGNVSHTNSEEEDLSMAMLRYANGSYAQLAANLVYHGQKQALSFSCERATVEIPHAITADRAQENGFPVPDEAFQRELQEAYDAIAPLDYEGHAGLADDLVRAVDEGTPVLVDGAAGRATIELIMAIYKSASECRSIALPLAPTDPFYTREGVRSGMPHFYEKTGYAARLEGDISLLADSMTK